MIKTNKQIKELLHLNSKTRRTCGNGLLVVRDPRSQKGGLYFTGTLQRRVPGKTKPVPKECWLGVFGSNPGQYTLQSAHQKWNEIKQWSIQEDKDPGDYWKRKRQEIESQKTLRDAVEAFLNLKEQTVKPTTLKEYRLKLTNQVMGIIPPETPLRLLEWDQGGRRIVDQAIERIASGSKYDLARRCQKLLFQMFNLCISKQWMERGQNPAIKLEGDSSPEGGRRHHKTIDWDQVPELLNRVSLNRSNTHINSVAATKLMLMTFLRAGALSRMEWEWVGEKFIIIPGTTPGLKRRRAKSDHIPHHVPITPQIKAILEHMEKLHGRGKYVFPQLRQSRYEHLDPSAPNAFLKRIGYDGELVAHGWRSVARTYGVDILKAREIVIQRQMGHLPTGKVEKAYDRALYLEERTEFMNKWCKLLEENGLTM
jgi:integrase